MTDSPAARLARLRGGRAAISHHTIGHRPPFSLGFGVQGGFGLAHTTVSGGFGTFRDVLGRFRVGG